MTHPQKYHSNDLLNFCAIFEVCNAYNTQNVVYQHTQ